MQNSIIFEQNSSFVGSSSEENNSNLLYNSNVSNELNKYKEVPSKSIANDINHIFGIISPHEYYQVVSKDATNSLTYDNKINISSVCSCNKITLIDFPLAPYILSLNGNNIMTSKNNIFNIDDNKTDLAKDLINAGYSYNLNIFKGTKPPIDFYECKYINLERYDSCRINYPSSVKLDKYEYHISISGYYYENNSWIYKEEIINVYPNNTYNLGISYVTESIDFMFAPCNYIMNTIDEQEVIFLIDGLVYEKITGETLKKNNFIYRLKTDRSKCKTLYPNIGTIDTYFNDYIIENTIQFSRVASFKIILKNIKITNVTQHYYMVFRYPSRIPIFAS